MAYVDTHLHLLPGVDDGPRTPEETVELGRVLAGDGVETVAVTPHFNAWNPDLLHSIEEVERRVADVQSLLDTAGVPLNVRPGAEHFLTPDLLAQVRDGSAPTLAGGPYLLIELPFGEKPMFVDDALFQLSLSGVSLVLAHPERYQWVQKNPAAVSPLVDRDVALQLTAASLLGQYGGKVRKTAQTLLHHGMYSLAGSDLHRPDQPRRLSMLEAAIVETAGQSTADLLLRENPARVIAGQPLRYPEVVPFDEGRKSLFGWLSRD